jgi:SAM-dependent methyltransferase
MLAHQVTSSGRVIATDKSTDMVAAASERCASLDQVSAQQGDVTALAHDDASYDAVTCTQVLLYVADVDKAISEMTRVLKPGGKLAILETDWHGTVMNSNYPEITDRIYASWDQAVPSPNLPRRLTGLMRNAGCSDIYAEAIPLLNNEFDPTNFSVSSLDWLSGSAYKQGAITKEESKTWRDDLMALGQNGEYFFCVNRFLFVGNK